MKSVIVLPSFSFSASSFHSSLSITSFIALQLFKLFTCFSSFRFCSLFCLLPFFYFLSPFHSSFTFLFRLFLYFPFFRLYDLWYFIVPFYYDYVRNGKEEKVMKRKGAGVCPLQEKLNSFSKKSKSIRLLSKHRRLVVFFYFAHLLYKFRS